jgi:hypothetical protein
MPEDKYNARTATSSCSNITTCAISLLCPGIFLLWSMIWSTTISASLPSFASLSLRHTSHAGLGDVLAVSDVVGCLLTLFVVNRARVGGVGTVTYTWSVCVGAKKAGTNIPAS